MNSIAAFFTLLRIHPLFYLFMIGAIITGHFREIIMLFFIVTIHEMGHFIPAYWFKWRIEKIELLPFGGVVKMNEYGNRPLVEEWIVILAGPFMHVILIGIGYVLTIFHLLDGTLFQTWVVSNLSVLLFNLLPIWPLDGGKIIFFILSHVYPYRLAHDLLLLTSVHLLMVTGIGYALTVPFQLNIFVLLCFLASSIWIEWRQRHFLFMRFLIERFYGEYQPTKEHTLTVSTKATVQETLRQFFKNRSHVICIRSHQKKQEASIREQQLLHAYFIDKKVKSAVSSLFR